MSGHPWQWFGDRTFSQHGEDLLLQSIFHCLGIERPTYLDIGCNDPFVISNTALLYLRGSAGINIDIDPACIARFHRHRPEDMNLVAAVGPERGKAMFYHIGTISNRGSFVRELIEPYSADNTMHEVEVDVITLDYIVEHFASGVFPDLLSIDIEGYDVPVLQSFDFTKTSPSVIIGEGYCDNHDFHVALRDTLITAGFFFYAWAGSNMVFVHERHRAAVYF